MNKFSEWEDEVIKVVLYWLAYSFISQHIYRFMNWYMPKFGTWLTDVGLPMWVNLIVGLIITVIVGGFLLIFLFLVITRSLVVIAAIVHIILNFRKRKNEPVSGRTEKSIKS